MSWASSPLRCSRSFHESRVCSMNCCRDCLARSMRCRRALRCSSNCCSSALDWSTACSACSACSSILPVSAFSVLISVRIAAYSRVVRVVLSCCAQLRHLLLSLADLALQPLRPQTGAAAYRPSWRRPVRRAASAAAAPLPPPAPSQPSRSADEPVRVPHPEVYEGHPASDPSIVSSLALIPDWPTYFTVARHYPSKQTRSQACPGTKIPRHRTIACLFGPKAERKSNGGGQDRQDGTNATPGAIILCVSL